SVPGVFMVWLVAGILTFFGALVCAEMASIFTQTGGVYVFLRESFSPSVGFLWGWAMFWSIHSGIIAAIAVI
ncbi:MAG: amino acid transporter, partial [Candidatus Aminicenantes bacterium]|nr:amino acid transporter [Candidatus Aminicenantes bacterium]NIQ66400.1 amino acid transporter [Candidatus Aminicenantes bacterium]NIT22434.1 amino acid transporter [Candidatus Aminicenantes bacterium]